MAIPHKAAKRSLRGVALAFGSMFERVIILAATDEALVEIIKNSPQPMQCNEMGVLLYRYSRVIRIKAAKLKTVSAEPEDLEQEGFIALFSAVKAYSPEKGSFSAFANACIANRMKNSVMHSASRLKKAEDYDFEQIADEAVSTDDSVILKEYNIDLHKRLSSLLSAREYSVLSLYLEGYSYKQIAQKLGVSLKSVDNSLSRTRKKLKDFFN